MTFTHTLNQDFQSVTAGEFYKEQPVSLIKPSGNYSQVRINNVEIFIPTTLLTQIDGVVA